MSVAEGLIDVLRWEDYSLAGQGSAAPLADAFRGLLSSGSGNQANQAWNKYFENKVFAQDTVYSAAVPALEVALAALTEERPKHVRFFLVELIFLLVNGEGEDDQLTGCIRELAMSGWWIIAREAVRGWPAHRETALYILEALDADRAEKIARLLPPAAEPPQ